MEKSEPTSKQELETEYQQDDESDNMGEKTLETMPDSVDKKKRKRRPPLVPWKKPKDMPRRPLSAYNIFFKEQREAMMAKVASAEKAAAEANPEVTEIVGKSRRKRSNKSVGIGFANLARTIAADWKDLDEATRAPYEAIAAKEKARYKEEMLVWRAKQKEEKDKSGGSGDDQSPYPGGALDSSGETTMDDSHASSRATPTAFPTQATRPMEVDSPKRSRFAYQQPIRQSMLSQMGTLLDGDFTPIQLTSDVRGRWSEVGSQSYPLGMDQTRAAAAAYMNQPLHASLSRLDALQANAMMADDSRFGFVGLGAVGESTIPGHGLPGVSMFNPHASDSAIGMSFSAQATNRDKMQNNHFGRSGSVSPSHMYQNEEFRLIMQQQRLHQHQNVLQQQFLRQQEDLHSFHGQQHHPAARRNTWSGGAANIATVDNAEPGFGRTMQHGRNEMRTSYTPPPTASSSAVASNIPDSWFEPEDYQAVGEVHHHRRASAPPSQPNQVSLQIPKTSAGGSTLYPDTWFEVAEEEPRGITVEEPMRHSPDGDLTGKLPGSSGLFGKHSNDTPTFHKSSSGEGKMEDRFNPPMRSLEDIAGSCNATSMIMMTSVQEEEPVDKQQEEFGALGMHFDDDTMDFLARLRQDANQMGNPSSTSDTH